MLYKNTRTQTFVNNFMRIGTKINKDASPRGRGRPKAYVAEAALDAMRKVFWNKGFSATSLDDLCEVSGMNRPSLYNAFGDKAAIFRRVLGDFANYLRRRYIEAFNKPLPLRRSIEHVFATALRVYVDEKEKPLGCLMMSVALTDAANHPEIAEIVLGAMHDLESGFRYRFRQAIEAGELSADAPIDDMAATASALHSALAVRIRAGESLDSLTRYMRAGLNLILPKG